MLITKSVKDENQFGKWKDATPSTVVGSAYDTSGNGGRKVVKLDNGTLVAVAKDTAVKGYRIYKSADGITWTTVISNINYTSFSDVAICAVGNTIGTLFNYNDVGIQFELYNLDGTRVQPAKTVDSVQTAMGNVSLCIDGTGTLHAAWASKNSTYPNSFNIRYSKSTDGGTTWESPTQITTSNSAGQGYDSPCIAVKQNNNPIIVFRGVVANPSKIYCSVFDGTSWVGNTNSSGAQGKATDIYNGVANTQSNPCAVVDSNDNIHVVWHGKDATDTAVFNIRYAKSTDGGATWSAMTKLTSGNSTQYDNPTLAITQDNTLHVVYSSSNSTALIRSQKNSAGTWVTGLFSKNSTANSGYPSLLANGNTVSVVYKYPDGGTVEFNTDPRFKVPDLSPSIVESYIPLWSADGSFVSTTTTSITTSGSNFLQNGTTTPATTSTPTAVSLFTLNSKWTATAQFAFETTAYAQAVGGTFNAALWDITSNSLVSSTQVGTTSTSMQVSRSAKFTLVPGHSYGVTFWLAASGNWGYICDASLVVFG